MRKLLFIPILFLVVNFAFAQNNDYVFAVSNNAVNVLYIGIDNELTIAVSNISPDDYTVTFSNGLLYSLGNCKYIIKPNRNEIGTLEIFDKNINLIGSKEYKCKPVPNPRPVLIDDNGSQVYAGHYTKDELLSITKVGLDMFDFLYDIDFNVVGFTLSITSDYYGFTYSKSTDGDTLTNEQIAMINNSKPGYQVEFIDIKAQAPDGNVRHVGAIFIRIKD